MAEKKRRWLSTDALKEFINEISEEELQAEERFNEKLDSLEDPLDIQERLNRTLFQRDQLMKERDEWIRINHKNQERINVLEEQIQKIQTEDEQKKKERSSEQEIVLMGTIRRLEEELATLKRERLIHIQELENEKEELKERLDVEQTRFEEELNDRNEHWKHKLEEAETEKVTIEKTLKTLQQQLVEKEQEREELTNKLKELEAEKGVPIDELMSELEELKQDYQSAQKKNSDYEKEVEQLKREALENQEKLEKFTKNLERINEQEKEIQRLVSEKKILEDTHQQLHKAHQIESQKKAELRVENDVLLELIEKKDRELQAYQNNETKLNQLLEERLIENNQLEVEDSQMEAGEQGQTQEEVKEAPEQESTEMTEDVEKLVAEKEALNSALFDAHEEISKFEEKMAHLEELEAEKETLEHRLENAQAELSDLQEQKSEEESLELLQTKEQVKELLDKNEQLKKEVVQSQQEIGEVLISAKKQANRTIEEAQAEAKHMINSAELELETIGNRAKKILIEVSESRKSVLSIYDELEFKVESLSNGTLLKEIKKKKQEEGNRLF